MAADCDFVPRGVPVAFSGRVSKVSKWADPGSFQITACVLGLRACEILHMSFKNVISFLQPSGSLVLKSCWPSKPVVLRAPLPGAGPLGW